MNVSNVAVLTVTEGDPLCLNATLFSFDRRAWVGLREQGEFRFGPAALLPIASNETRSAKRRVKIKEAQFPLAHLAEIDGRFVYKDQWTIPRGTLFILVMPPGYVGSDMHVFADEKPLRLMTGVDDQGALYYYTTFEDAPILGIEMVVGRDDQKYLEARGQLGPATAQSSMLGHALGALRSGITLLDVVSDVHGLIT